MTKPDRRWNSQEILWEMGASFADATAESAAPVVEQAMERIGTTLRAASVAVWQLDSETMSGSAIAKWAADPSRGLDGDFVAHPDPAVREAIDAGGGIAVVGLESVLGVELCAQRGWSDGYALIALVDEHDDAIVALTVASATNEWPQTTNELIQGSVLLLRQFYSRMRADERLHEQLRLDDLVVGLAARFQTATIDTVVEEIEAAVGAVKVGLGLTDAFVIDVIDDRTIDIATTGETSNQRRGFERMTIPDISHTPWSGGQSLREWVGVPRIVDLADVVDDIMGSEASAGLSLRETPQTIALLPASVSGAASNLVVTRGAGEVWTSWEIDALSTLASMIAQTRGRVAAERASLDLLEAQRALVGSGKRFLEADGSTAEAAVTETLEGMANHLGAELAVVTDVRPDRETVMVSQLWASSDAYGLVPGSVILRADNPFIDRLIAFEPTVAVHDVRAEEPSPLHRSADGKWTAVAAPIRATGSASSSLTFVWASGEAPQIETASELVSATADLIGQLRVRLRAEDEINARLHLDRVLSDLAERFLGGSLETADQVVPSAIETLGRELGLGGLCVRAAKPGRSVVEAVWAEEGRPSPAIGQSIEFDRVLTLDDLVAFDTLQTEPRWVDYLSSQWGDGVVVSVLPIGGEVESLLSVVHPRALTVSESEVLRTFAVMLGQFRARVAEERIAQRRLDAQRLLSKCAAELAEATPDTLREVIAGVMGNAAEFCEIELLIDWAVDTRQKRYVRASIWADDDIDFVTSSTDLAWGLSALLDTARETGELTTRQPHDLRAAGRVRLAVPRGDGATVEHIVFAATRAESWPDETIELLASLSRMIREVGSRTSAQRYAQAAFEGAPISVVLRDQDLNLITCNQAFVDFLGASSIESLVGTPPHHVYDDPYEEVSWKKEDNGQLTAEAAYRGPGGARVWGQMRGSVVEGETGEHFWLIHIEDVTERRRAEQLLRFQATHDELTGLANRRRLLDEIHQIADGAESVGVLLLDLDRFKNINDSLGHDRGDELLVVVADRLRLAVRPGDLVARLGGDEFAVVLPGPVTVADAEFVAERLLRLIGEPVALGSQVIYPAASIGIAVADEDTAVDDLIRRADTAMYRAKSQGRARSEAFDEDLRDAVQVRMETEAGLRGALRTKDLIVHYQPEVSLHDGRVLGAEALVRWQHPTKGLLPAGAFIEVAEETGLVVEIGELVLNAACAEAVTWPGGPDAPIIRVNLAAAQIQREETVDLVTSVLASTGLHPSRLCLEITESAVMSDVTRSEQILGRLKALGLHLAVDDFGTGFSSLAYLKRFPVDALKIDRAFVSDLGHDGDDVAFVRSIVSLADALSLSVVAEGVETLEQAEILLELGCHRAQGFYFAKPGPADQLHKLMAEGVG